MIGDRAAAHADYRCDRDFPGWDDLTAEQKGHIVDIETAAFWRGHNYAPPSPAAAPPAEPADPA